jgi:hypothetical protein
MNALAASITAIVIVLSPTTQQLVNLHLGIAAVRSVPDTGTAQTKPPGYGAAFFASRSSGSGFDGSPGSRAGSASTSLFRLNANPMNPAITKKGAYHDPMRKLHPCHGLGDDVKAIPSPSPYPPRSTATPLRLQKARPAPTAGHNGSIRSRADDLRFPGFGQDDL